MNGLLVAFSETFGLGCELAYGLPYIATAHGQILVNERIGYEIRRWRRGIGARPTAAALKRWAEEHGVTWGNPWWTKILEASS
jgi:hypothetical protein